MVRHRFLSRPQVISSRSSSSWDLPDRCRAQPAKPSAPGRVFAASVFSIDEILSRPFDRDVPMGCTGDRLWASSPQGWAFRDDVQWLYLTNLKAFDLELRDEHGRLRPGKSTYFPSHIHYEGTARGDQGHGLVHLRAWIGSKTRCPRRLCPRSAGRAGRAEIAAIGSRSTSACRGWSAASTCSSLMMRPAGECRPPATFEVEHLLSASRDWGPITLSQVVPERPRPGKIASGSASARDPVSLPVSSCRRSILHGPLRPATDLRRRQTPRGPRQARCKSPATNSSRIPTSWFRSCECIIPRARSRRFSSIRRSTWERRSITRT